MPGVVAATAAAGATVIVGISVWASLGAISPFAASQSAVAPDAAAAPVTAGTRGQGHGTVDSAGPLARQRQGTPAQHGKPRQAAISKPTAKPSAKPGSVTGRHPAARTSAAPARQAKPAKPYMFYDSVTPQAVPAGAQVATYATGARPVPVSAVAGRKNVLWIDTLGTDPAAQVIDVEPGCASPSQVPGWVSRRLTSHRGQVAIVYTTISEWSQVQADVAALPSWMKSRIRWWIADPTGSPHIVPGSQATQWYWGSSYDISMAEPGFERA